MLAHVICCNDSVEFVVVDDEDKAKVKMVELRDSYLARNKWNFRDADDYVNRCYWHIRTVDAS